MIADLKTALKQIALAVVALGVVVALAVVGFNVCHETEPQSEDCPITMRFILNVDGSRTTIPVDRCTYQKIYEEHALRGGSHEETMESVVRYLLSEFDYDQVAT